MVKMPKKESREFVLKQLGTVKSMKADLVTWLGIHGNLCLALRHPQNKGPSRAFLVAFVKRLGWNLVEWGAITEEELRHAEQTEREEGSTDLATQ